jgi:hypothetical protein
MCSYYQTKAEEVRGKTQGDEVGDSAVLLV